MAAAHLGEVAVCAGNMIQVFCSVLSHFQCHSEKTLSWLTRQQNYNATELKQDVELGTKKTRGECDKVMLKLMGRNTQDRVFCSRWSWVTYFTSQGTEQREKRL